MALGAIADEPVRRPSPDEIDADRDAFADIGVVGIDQPLARMQRRASASRVEQRVAAAEADLRQPRAFAHQHRKGARADLGIKRAVIAGARCGRSRASRRRSRG